MPQKTTLNIELFKKIKKHIKARPARLRMDNWLRTGDAKSEYHNSMPGYGEPDRFKLPECGTVGCIAGWAYVLARPDLEKDPNFKLSLRSGGSINIASYGAKDLGITQGIKPFELFYVDYWPQPWVDNYRNAKTQKERAKIVCEIIDEFIRQYQMVEKGIEDEVNARKA